jgi:ABC-type multidrug transport system ATPase subunit
MDEAARCDRVALMQNGRILQENTPEFILNDFQNPLFEIYTGDRLNMLNTLRSVPEIKRAYLFGHSIHITLNHQYDKVWLEKRLNSESIHNYTITAIKPDFEDCFIDVVEQDKLINNRL